MKINLSSLIYLVQGSCDDMNIYMSKSESKEWYELQEISKTNYRVSAHEAETKIMNFAEILNFDIINLYRIARLIRNWEQKRDWQRCFPIDENYDSIVEYLMKEDKYNPANHYNSTGRKKQYIG